MTETYIIIGSYTCMLGQSLVSVAGVGVSGKRNVLKREHGFKVNSLKGTRKGGGFVVWATFIINIGLTMFITYVIVVAE